MAVSYLLYRSWPAVSQMATGTTLPFTRIFRVEKDTPIVALLSSLNLLHAVTDTPHAQN